MRDHPLQRHPIIAWFAGNPVVANVIMFSILAAGVYTAIKVRKETFPSFDAQRVEVRVPFLGGTPEDVERGVTIKIEEALQKIEGIDHIRSVSRESGSTVTISALEDYPIDELLKDIKIQVDAIPSFPGASFAASEAKSRSAPAPRPTPPASLRTFPCAPPPRAFESICVTWPPCGTASSTRNS